MSELLGTTVEELTRSLKARRVRIPPEIGAFIVLEVCEALLDGPAAPGGADVRLAADGTIGVYAPPGSATSEEGARAALALLGSLLVAAGTGVPQTLVGLLEHGPSSGRWDLPSLRDDLEASLVPLNRAAARRILSRMLREAGRAGPAPAASTGVRPPREQSLDAQLDDLLGGALSEPPPSRPDASRPEAPPPEEPKREATLDRELDATLDELSAPPRAPRRASAPRAPDPEDATIAEEEPALLGARSRALDSDRPTLDPPEMSPRAEIHDPPDYEPGHRGSPMPWLLAFVAILAATAAALALMRPDLVDALIGRPPPPEVPAGPTEADRERTLREHRARFGTLTVQAAPPESQVLLYVGRGPAIAEDLPLGVAHEFVVIADGRVPTRTVLPSDATWEERAGGRHYELAMQTGEAEMAAADLALGPTRLPRDVGAPSTVLGDVRVVTNPPGAKVYVLVGFSPEVVVENVPTDAAVELLVYHEGHPVSRAILGPSDWREAEDGSKSATTSITLDGYTAPAD